MLKTILISLLPLLALFSNGSDHSLTGLSQNAREANTGKLEKMIVASGSVAMDLNLNRFNETGAKSGGSMLSAVRFDIERDSFFYNNGF